MAEKRSGSPHDCLMISASLTSCAGNADITAAMSGSSVSSSAFQRRVPTPSSPIPRELFAHRGRAGATAASTWSIPVTLRDRIYEQNLRNAALVDRRCLSLLYVRLQVAQLDSCVVGGELPVDLTLVGVGLLLPGGELGVEHGEVLDAAVQALAAARGELVLGDVEPGPVLGRVADLQALGQPERRL